MEGFTPYASLAGGALIGLSAALLWLANGRIAGISGIIGGLLAPLTGEVAWRAAFLTGLVAGPILYRAANAPSPTSPHPPRPRSWPPPGSWSASERGSAAAAPAAMAFAGWRAFRPDLSPPRACS